MKFANAVIAGVAALVIGQASVRASMTLLAGPSTATHVGNLVTNGSFETGAPSPGAGQLSLLGDRHGEHAVRRAAGLERLRVAEQLCQVGFRRRITPSDAGIGHDP